MTTEDVVALWQLQARYADIVTCRDWGQLAEVFLPDTAVEIDTVTAPVRRVVGPDEFGQFVAGAIERYDYFAFTILNTVVEVDRPPDEAAGRFFMCEIRHETAIDAWHNAYGIYQDRYRRVDGRWWIAERRYRSMARGGPNAAVLGLPEGLKSLGPSG